MRSDPSLTEHHLRVPRTARYYLVGEVSETPRALWFACHGYGQLAGRFARHFAPIAGAGRLVVAPEGLSRFYHETPRGRSTPDARVGASWMTREDRLVEIDDHVEYLDRLHDALLPATDRATVPVVAFGFSQGVATVARWLAQGRARADHLVLWAGRLPPELALDRPPFDQLPITFVVGDHDEHLPPSQRDAEVARLQGRAAPLWVERFAGGHALDTATLQRVAAAIDGAK